MATDTMTVSGVVWDRVEDGEYNQWTTTVGTTRIDVSSDRYGENWDCMFNEGETYSLEATCLQDAMREAIYDATH